MKHRNSSLARETTLDRASDRVRKKFGNYAALLGLIMRQERSIMRQIMRFHFS